MLEVVILVSQFLISLENLVHFDLKSTDMIKDILLIPLYVNCAVFFSSRLAAEFRI
jgi:hypothetical protein